jgi:hypothetical protein
MQVLRPNYLWSLKDFTKLSMRPNYGIASKLYCVQTMRPNCREPQNLSMRPNYLCVQTNVLRPNYLWYCVQTIFKMHKFGNCTFSFVSF